MIDHRSNLRWLYWLWGAFLVAGVTRPALAAAPSSEEPIVVRYHVLDESLFNYHYQYFLALLELSLSKSGRAYNLSPVQYRHPPTPRVVNYLKSGKIHVTTLHTSNDLEAELLPIRIPIYKGLIGWRLMLMQRSQQSSIGPTISRYDIQQLHAGLGINWPDVNIFEHNHFNYHTADTWKSVLNLLDKGRVDYFPRGIIEIWEEFFNLSLDQRMRISIDNDVVLVYPSAYYLFVSKDNIELAELIEIGLERAIADGSFQKLFDKSFGRYIERANINERRVFKLENPSLPKITPLSRKELWFRPEI